MCSLLFNEDKKVQHPACLSQDSEGPLLLLAIAGTDVHPPLLAGFAVGGSNLVIDGRDAGGPQRVDVAQWALVMAFSLGDLLLSKGNTSLTAAATGSQCTKWKQVPLSRHEKAGCSSPATRPRRKSSRSEAGLSPSRSDSVLAQLFR